MSENCTLIPMKRKSLDGKVWWCVWDNIKKYWSPFTCFGKYKLKKDCAFAISYYSKEWGLYEK